MEERLRQTITILRKLRDDLGLPLDSPEVDAIKKKMQEFVQDGIAWRGVFPLQSWDREAVLEMEGTKIELTLRTKRLRGRVQ